MRKIDEEEFWFIKKKTRNALGRQRNLRVVANEVGRSYAKVSIIASCRNYKEYERIKEAEHPPLKNSLTDRVTELEHRVDALEERDQRRNTHLALELNKDGIDGKPDVKNIQ